MAGKNEIPINVLMQYFRVPTGELVVDYPGRGMLLASCITNISTTGVFIRTNNPLPKGAELEISFALPPDNKIKIKAQTVVRWSVGPDSKGASREPGQPVGMGLEFTRMPPAQRKAISRFVEDYLERIRKG